MYAPTIQHRHGFRHCRTHSRPNGLLGKSVGCIDAGSKPVRWHPSRQQLVWTRAVSIQSGVFPQLYRIQTSRNLVGHLWTEGDMETVETARTIPVAHVVANVCSVYFGKMWKLAADARTVPKCYNTHITRKTLGKASRRDSGNSIY